MGTHDEKATAAEADKAADTGTATPAAEATRPLRDDGHRDEDRPAEDRGGDRRGAAGPGEGCGRDPGRQSGRGQRCGRLGGSRTRRPRKATACSDPAATSVTKPVGKVTAGVDWCLGQQTCRPEAAAAGSGKGKQALTSVGSGVRKLRNLIASLIWLIAVLAAAVLALGALFTALDQTNQSNEIVRWILERGHDLVGPFKDLFRLETAKNTLLVNWGIAALVYLIAGKIIERFVRP